MKKHLLWIIPLVLVLVAGFVFGLLALIEGSQIEDTNGSDTSLCTLTDEDIFASHTSSVASGSISTQVNRKLTLRISKFSGVKEATAFSARGSKLTIQISTKLEEGNLRVLLLCDGEYVMDLPVNAAETVTIDNPDGRYEIRIAGESAKLSMECSYEVE